MTHPRLVVLPPAEICARHFFVGRNSVTPRNLLLFGGMVLVVQSRSRSAGLTSHSSGRPRFQIRGNGAGTLRMSPRVTSAFSVKQTATGRGVCLCASVRLAETRCRVPGAVRGAPNGGGLPLGKSKK